MKWHNDLDVKVSDEKYVLLLFVTGMSLGSIRAIENITDVCEKYLQDRYSLEIIDVYKDPTAVQLNDIIACPTLIKRSPSPFKRLIGDLSDKKKVLSALDIKIQK
jgi:circadian clock protein KaiB